MYHLTVGNISAVVRFMKFYDKASAPVVGTDIPFWTLPIPVGGFSESFIYPVSFALGLAYAITSGAVDSDTTAIAANDIHGFVTFA